MKKWLVQRATFRITSVSEHAPATSMLITRDLHCDYFRFLVRMLNRFSGAIKKLLKARNTVASYFENHRPNKSGALQIYIIITKFRRVGKNKIFWDYLTLSYCSLTCMEKGVSLNERFTLRVKLWNALCSLSEVPLYVW